MFLLLPNPTALSLALDLLLGRLEKFNNEQRLFYILSLAGSNRTPLDLLHACQVNEIPILIIAPTAVHGRGAESLGEARRFVALVDPGDLRSAFEQVAG